jgi:Spy/CpxP family protein refolding chaperone
MLVIVSSSLAQPPGRGRLSPEEKAVELQKVLNLSDSLTAKVKTIYEEQQAELQKQFESSGGDRMAMREAMQAKGKETDEKILALLNDEQKAQYADFVKQRRSRFEQRPRPQREE